MTQILTDRTALSQHRRRAASAPALFLHEAAADEIEFRLSLVNRTFMRPLIVSGWPDFWSARFPEALCVMDDDVLEVEPGAHDLVIHAMALHWAPDPVGQLIQARRALRADGLFLGIFPGGESLSELRSVLAEAEISVTGGLSPRVLPMATIRDLGMLMQRAELALPVVDSETLTVSYRSLWHLMEDLRAMGETNAMAARLRVPSRRALFQRAADLYATHFGQETGRVRATFELMTLTGWSPGAGQPQPLRPGSAIARLADALGTDEQSLEP